MKKIVHKSVIPLYATAAMWLLYAWLFPLYKPRHYILAVVTTAFVGLVAKALCRDTVEEVPEEKEEEKPRSTGNPELDRAITDAKLAISEMKRLDDAIEDEEISAQIVRLEQLTGKIYAHVEQHPGKLPQIRKFMSYYLPTTLKLLNAYDRMDDQGIAGDNVAGSMEKVRGILSTIVTAFEKQLDNLFGREAMDISSDITVLENMLAREGLGADPLHAAAQAAEEPQAAAEKKEASADAGITLEL